MSTPDIKIIETFSLKILKVFDRGEIDRLYQGMYDTAEHIAATETRLYKAQVLLEWRNELLTSETPRETSESRFNRVAEYRKNRLQFHLDQMSKLLQLYVKSKETNCLI